MMSPTEVAHEQDNDVFGVDGQQFLTFHLGNETYGVPILSVQEIRGYAAATPIPNSAPWVKGVMNLRGTVVPVADLRERFALAEAPVNRFTVVIVVQLAGRVVGLIVDAVSDVVVVADADIRPAPALGASIDTSCLAGLAMQGEQLVLLLDVARLVETGLDLCAA
jgi:purine-binding chemotaxis protein CheW